MFGLTMRTNENAGNITPEIFRRLTRLHEE